MATPIKNYAFLSDMRTGFLISTTGSIDWMCLPRFDSDAVFSALLGTPKDGRWVIAPTVAMGDRGSTDPSEYLESCGYLKDTFVLETVWKTPDGRVKVTDFMPLDGPETSDVARRVEGLEGAVEMTLELRMRFGYGAIMPWVYRHGKIHGQKTLVAIAGPSAIAMHAKLLPKPRDGQHELSFVVKPGEVQDFTIAAYPSHEDPPARIDVDKVLKNTIENWRTWIGEDHTDTKYDRDVRRSLLVLRALTDELTGGIVAAATTSLPEEFGGTRNWDYRYVWLRDAALTIEAMLGHGHADEASRWRNWLLRAVAGDPDDIQIMYGVAGERNLAEIELDHLAGYENSRPVRIGNGAVGQYQADVVGTVMTAFGKLREAGVEEDEYSWPLQRAMLKYQIDRIQNPDNGIWEMRGEPDFFTHGRVMIWAAFDRAVRAVEEYGLDGDVELWREIRDTVRAEVLTRGFNTERNTFTQVYGGKEVDASLLQIPQVGFLPYDDPRVLGTVEAIEHDLVDDDGYVHRYKTLGKDGLTGSEYPFTICSFWLAEQFARSGRLGDAERLMDSLVGISSELGLLSEEYASDLGRMAGNFPQAFSHLGLVRAADAIHSARGERDENSTTPARRRPASDSA